MSITKLFVLLTMAALLAACASKTSVLIYPMASSEAYLQQLRTDIEHEGFQVEIHHEFPASYLATTTVVYGLGDSDAQGAKRVQALLLRNGQHDVDVGQWRVENHQYTHGYLGVYLFEPGQKIDQQALEQEIFNANADKANDYHNERCGRGDLRLVLGVKGVYGFSRSLWDANKSDYVETRAAGYWSQAGDEITTSGADGHATFKMIHDIVDEAGRKLHQVRLQRESGVPDNYLDGCSFVMRASVGE